MTKLRVTSKIKGDTGELLFEHFCQRNQYAYIRLEEIYNSLTPRCVLSFRYGDRRIKVEIPTDIQDEVRRFSIPINNDDSTPNFVYDFLTVSLRFSFQEIDNKYIQQPYLTKKAFNWIEIKTGKSKLSKSQKSYKKKSIIGVQLFRVITQLPNNYEVTYEELNF